MSKLTIQHDVNTVHNFIGDVSSNDKLHYVFLGKHTPWEDDNNPPTANLSVVETELSLYNDILFGKHITGTDVCVSIKRHDWTANTVYAMYDDIDSDLLDKNFYVLTNDNNVYKCIYNNDGRPSTVEPVTMSTSIFELPDGYKWKYMFTLDAQTRDKFITDDYIPVANNETVINAAVAGTINHIMVTDDGYDYRTYHTGNLVYVSNSEFVTIANTASSEDNFYTDSGIYLASGLGAGQLRKIKSYDGATKQVAVSEPFDVFSVLTVENPQGIIEVGQTIKQRYARITTDDKVGYFRKEALVGALGIVQQADTIATGRIAYANDESMIVEVVGTTDFLVNGYPIINKDDGGSQLKGVVATSKIFLANTTTANVQIVCNVASGFAATVNTAAFFANTVVTGSGIPADTTIVSANNTHVQLSKAPTATATGVSITFSNRSLVFGTANTDLPSLVGPASFTFETAADKYIRVGYDGSNLARNVRKVETVGNDILLRVTQPFISNIPDSWIYQIHHAFTITSYALGEAYGTITALNLESIKVKVSNPTKDFTVGETVQLVEKSGRKTVHTAVVTFSGIVSSNELTLILSNVSNLNAFYNYDLDVLGLSSAAKADLTSTKLYPSITYREVSGKIIEGIQFSTYTHPTSQSVLGTGVIIGTTYTPDASTQYIISPYVYIEGDGTEAAAYSVIDGTANSVFKIEVINPGQNYSYSNVSIQANSLYGTTATARAIISPFHGHGKDPAIELGGKYACVSLDFRNVINESYKFPGYGSFRKVGIIRKPTYNEMYFNMSTPTTANVTIGGSSGTWTAGDILLCGDNSVAKIKSVDSNGVNPKLVLTNIQNSGTPIANAQYCGGYPSNSGGQIIEFSYNLFANGDVITQETTGATAVVDEVLSNTEIRVTGVNGWFEVDSPATDGQVVYNTSGNSGAYIESIKIDNNSRDVTSSYYQRFNQLTRVTLSSNTAAFEQNAEVTQTLTGAHGYIYDTSNNIDLAITNMNGVFTEGSTLIDSTSSANGYILFANTSYIKLTSVSGTFGVGHYVTTAQGGIATIGYVYPVLTISENKTQFADGNNFVYIQQTKYANGYPCSGVTGYHSNANTITRPDLTRDSGDLIYIENTGPITRSKTSREEIRLVIKM
jgi:hypothetical protein